MDHSALGPWGDDIGRIDAIARAAHLWVRHLEPSTSQWREDGHLAFVAGVIAGLCVELRQSEGSHRVVAYVYALLDGFGTDALRQANAITAACSDAAHAGDYTRGREEAVGIVAWLRLPVERP